MTAQKQKFPVPPRPPTKPKQIRHHKMTRLELARRIFFIVLGACLVGVALEIFLVPNQIIDGGITGISIMSSHLSGVPIGIFLTLLNLPFLIIGYRTIGKTFALSTLLGVIVLSISTTLLHPVQAFT
ncbi:MAG: YitT family protein, partial [Cohnella sp.]|nr:YitT family protein [Cohnella sp.]